MTVRELSKLYYINKLIEEDEQELADLESRLQPGGMSMDGMPHNPSPKNMMEELVPLIVEIEKKIRRERDEYLEEYKVLREYINSVPDYHIRLIMQLRFIKLLEWKDVADAIGGNNTEDSVRKACYRYLKKTEKR